MELFGDYDPQGVRIIEDPYYGSLRNFETGLSTRLRARMVAWITDAHPAAWVRVRRERGHSLPTMRALFGGPAGCGTKRPCTEDGVNHPDNTLYANSPIALQRQLILGELCACGQGRRTRPNRH